jgi:nucleotide-binding universal stress UspA family protein
MKFLIAFSSPKRSALTIEVAARHAKALSAEIFVLRVVPDPKRVGVVAELIASERPMEKAKSHIAEAVQSLEQKGIKATGDVRIGRVGRTIIEVVKEVNADMVFVGTMGLSSSPFFMMPKDPIVNYLVEHCPASLVLVRGFVPADADND